MRGLAVVVVGWFVVLAATALPAPQAAAPEDVCVPACTVVGAMNAFTPRDVVMKSGATVTWTSRRPATR